MEYRLVTHTKPHKPIVFFLFLLVMLANYNIYIGFALKPYMLFSIFYLIFFMNYFRFYKMQLYEILMLLFYLLYCFTGVFSLYPASSLRILIGIFIYIACYFVMRAILGRTNGTIINQSIAAVGILFNLASLILYFAGLVKVRFLFEGDRIYEYGMMLDRDYPRLVGLMQDPNFFVFYNTIFFAYYLSNTKSTINKLGLALCIITNLLTFSRGGLLVMIILLAVYIVLNNPIKNIKLIVGIALSLVTTFIVLVNMNFNLYELLSSRVEASSEDGGSGRLVLWGRAWDYFTSNMYTGIGAFNFSDYNTFDYGDSLTVHNTFLDILAESGLLGIFFYMMFIAIVFAQLIRQKVHRTNSYLFLTFLGFVLQMGFLSVIINDIFFLYLAILSNHLNNHVILQKSKVHPESMSPLRGGVYDERFITDR